MLKTFATLGLAAAIFSGTMAAPITASAAEEQKTVKIGWAAWSDAEFVTKLAAKLIKDKLGQKVELVQTDVAPLYQASAAAISTR